MAAQGSKDIIFEDLVSGSIPLGGKRGGMGAGLMGLLTSLRYGM